MLEKYEESFDKDAFLQKVMKDGQLTKSKAVEICRKAIPKEPYYQRKLLKGLKEKYPEAFVVKIAQGAYSQGGLPDILVILDGHYFGFEVKRPLIGEVSKLQEMTMARIRAAGGTAEVVSWTEEAIWVIERWRGESNGRSKQ